MPRLGRRGTVGVMTGVALVPLIASAGAGLDMARLAMAKAALQTALDEAALAGAAAYQTSTAGTTAQTVATNYFNTYASTVSGTVTFSNFSATPATGTDAHGNSSYNVAVTATGTMNTSLMGIVGVKLVTFTASATAANPLVQPFVTMGGVKSSAWDANSVWMYSVPSNNNGTPNYAAAPTSSSIYEIGTNCTSNSTVWSKSSTCNSQIGATVPAKQTLPTIASTQPIGFMLINSTGGLSSYGKNQFGSQPGNMQVFYTGPMSLGQGPEQYTDTSTTLMKNMFNVNLTQATTSYSTMASSSTPNCSVIIQVVDPNNLPTSPPASGKCFSATDQASGVQYANMSCSQMAGRTFMYWWNDMGGSTDDKDYNDLYFTVQCSPGNGTIVTTGTAPTSTGSVALIQ